MSSPSRAIAQRARGVVGVAVAGAGCVTASLLLPGTPAALVALVVGLVLGNIRATARVLRPGGAWVMKPVLRAGVVVLGLQLSLTALVSVGWTGIAVIVVTMIATFFGTLLVGQWMRVSPVSRLLVATGVAICGASAIVAMASVVDPDGDADDEVARSVALVTIFGTLTLFVLPFLHAPSGLDDSEMGLWIGASVHEVAQVVASASAVSAVALSVATITKLGRVVLLAPLVAVTSVVMRREDERTGAERGDGRAGAKHPPLIPLFVIGFLIAIVVRTIVPFPDWADAMTRLVTTLLFSAALFALGLAVDIRSLIRSGGRVLLLGLVSTLIAVLTSLGVIVLLAPVD